jgi:hypothetical protein
MGSKFKNNESSFFRIYLRICDCALEECNSSNNLDLLIVSSCDDFLPSNFVYDLYPLLFKAKMFENAEYSCRLGIRTFMSNGLLLSYCICMNDPIKSSDDFGWLLMSKHEN